MTPEEKWDGPIQDAIREHDQALGHPIPSAPSVAESAWFKRFPNGGTSYSKPLLPVDWFRRAPNGGGTVFQLPGNTHVSLEEDEVLLKWLKDNYPTLSKAERRTAVQRLVQLGHRPCGLARALGMNYNIVHKLTVPEETLRRWHANGRKQQQRVPVTRVAKFAEQWRERAARGLSPAEALQLLDEMRALGPKPVDAKEDASAEGR